MKKIILFALVLGFVTINAQESTDQTPNKETEQQDENQPIRKYRTWAIGLDIGSSHSIMDLYSLESTRGGLWEKYGGVTIGGTVRLEKWVSSYLGFGGQIGYGQMHGSKLNYAFRTNYWRMNMHMNFNLLGVGAFNRVKPKIQKHALVLQLGLGQISNKPEMYYSDGTGDPTLLYVLTGDGQALNFDDATNESWTNTPMVLTGLEWRYRITPMIDLHAGGQFMWAMHDNLDGSWTLEQEEPNLRADRFYFNKTNDWLAYANIGANIYFAGAKTEDRDIIIYTNPFTEIEQRVSTNEDNIGRLMEDGDGDGVSDYFDKDPNTPEGYIVDGGGVSQDTDRDGIPDDMDKDPFSTKGCAVDADGVEYDEDNDGVPDCLDLEAGTPVGQLVNYQGVSIIDRIGGGAGSGSYFLPSVYFDFNKSFVTTANYQRMAVVKNYLKENPNAKLYVVGHTDPVGTESYNQNLSERRAKAVMKALVNDFDIDESRLEIKAKGETELISKRNDINRRVEFHIQ